MKITHVVCTFPPYTGGMGNVASEMVNRLIELNHDVRVITPIYGTPEVKEQEEEHIHRLTPRIAYGNAANLSDIDDYLEDSDVVHLHYPFFGTANLVRKWKKRHPKQALVVTYHMDTHADGWKGLIFETYSHFWLPKILRSADALHASSFDFIENSQANDLYKENRGKWNEIPFGVDTNRFQPRPKPKELFERYSLRRELPTILFVGGMDIAHNFKGIPELLEALSIVDSKSFEIQAVFVGDGNMRRQYEQKARSLNLNHVRFVGRVSDEELPAHYNMADAFVLPSVHQGEAFGLVQLEAIASGVPVIASDLPGVRSITKRAGKIVAPGDIEGLAETIADFLFGLEIEELRIAARLTAETEYSWDTVMPRIEAMYLKALDKCK